MKKVEKFLEKYPIEVLVDDKVKNDSVLYISEKFQKEMEKAGIDLIEVDVVGYHARGAKEIYGVNFLDEDGKILLTKTV